MGKDFDIIVREKNDVSKDKDTVTVVSLTVLKKGEAFEKKLATIAKNLVERLLPYFITQDYVCPQIVLSEHDGSSPLLLNDFVSNEVASFIQEIQVDQNSFTLQATETKEEFLVRIFRVYSPRNHKSRISLVAHKREVSVSWLQQYIPEFEDEFYEGDTNREDEGNRNYIIKGYVFGQYLDRNVSNWSAEDLSLPRKTDSLLGISQVEIETRAAFIAKDAVGADIKFRQEKKGIVFNPTWT